MGKRIVTGERTALKKKTGVKLIQPVPALSEVDAAWADALLREKGFTVEKLNKDLRFLSLNWEY